MEALSIFLLFSLRLRARTNVIGANGSNGVKRPTKTTGSTGASPRAGANGVNGAHALMCAGADAISARMVKMFDATHLHHACLFANKSSMRIKMPVYDGFGIWLVAHRLNKGWFVWHDGKAVIAVPINAAQFRALVAGLSWKSLVHDHTITVVQYPACRYINSFIDPALVC